MARKQMAISLPAGWNVDITFARDGAEGIDAIKAGKGDILFLDLNMPVMDGYEVLEAIRARDLPTLTIVVSGDIQPEARQRVLSLGALEFIQKPVNSAVIADILNKYGIRTESETTAANPLVEEEMDRFDGYREIANIAIGRAANLLARLLDAFVKMPIPQVNMIEAGELMMTLDNLNNGEKTGAVCQGFIGAEIAGEALLMFSDSSYSDIADLMKFEGEIDEATKTELLMDISSIVVGACLKGLTEQLEIEISQGHPIVIGQHIAIKDLIQKGASRWARTLAIEMVCNIENRNIDCALLLLFTEDSIVALDQRIALLMD